MNDDEQAIRQLISTWLAAMMAGDGERILGLMTEEVVFLAPGQLPMRGRAVFASAQVALKRFRIECSHEIQEVRVVGDWAYCWNELSVVMTPQNGGAPVIRAGNALSILNKQDDGRWLVVRDANMLALVQI